jgi:hypothetical protein
MLIKSNMWHPASEARQYEATGSRTSFKDRWNLHGTRASHRQAPVSDALQLMLKILTDDQKALWL